MASRLAHPEGTSPLPLSAYLLFHRTYGEKAHRVGSSETSPLLFFHLSFLHSWRDRRAVFPIALLIIEAEATFTMRHH